MLSFFSGRLRENVRSETGERVEHEVGPGDDIRARDESGEGGEPVGDVAHYHGGRAVTHGEDRTREIERRDDRALSVGSGEGRRLVEPGECADGVEVNVYRVEVGKIHAEMI